jgi:hypothetical protein
MRDWSWCGIAGLGSREEAKGTQFRVRDIGMLSVGWAARLKGAMPQEKFDHLVIAVGCKTNTFNTPGVAEQEGKDVSVGANPAGRNGAVSIAEHRGGWLEGHA